MMGHFRAFDKMILRNLTFCFNLGIRCAVMGKKRISISTTTGSCSETTLLHIFSRSKIFFLFMVHVIKHQKQ